MKRLKYLAFGALFVSTAAFAGYAVTGFGDTRAQAAADAEDLARKESYRKFKRDSCFTPVRPQDCAKDSGGWTCKAYVANHAGSC
jgi:hypothetical protein